MRINIRAATIEDLDLLVELRLEVLRTVFDLPKTADLSEFAASNRNYYAEGLVSGSHLACLGYADGQVIATADACLNMQMPSPDCTNGQYAWIMNVYTEATYRHQGVGTQMIAKLIDQLKQRGITRVLLQTTDAGRHLYQEAGFVQTNDYMELLLD